MRTCVIALALGLLINAFGNALTITSSMGSGVWTAAAVNLSHVTGVSVGLFIFAFGVFNTVCNQFLLWTVDIPRFVEEIFYISCFSYAVNFFTNLCLAMGLGQLGLIARIVMAILGVTLFCIAISMYQRANLFMHPNDDTSNILRFKYCHGSAVASQLIDMLPPIIIFIGCGLLMGKIYSVNVGTIYSICCNGLLIKYADRWIWPSLVHNFRKNENYGNR